MCEDLNCPSPRTADGSNSWCFACGKNNPIGLHLQFEVDENSCRTTFTPQRFHESYAGRCHGGLLSTILDETLGNYSFLYEHRVVYTARLELRYRQPVPIGVEVRVEGRVKRRKGRLIEMIGEISLPDGTIAVEADAKMMYED